MVIYMYMYIDPECVCVGGGADQHLGPISSQNNKSSIHLPISFMFFFLQNAWTTCVDLAVNRARSSQGHDLPKLCRVPLPDASCQVSKS